jgi:sulfatase maturation enzyme AslB (radical SAM superfamily)
LSAIRGAAHLVAENCRGRGLPMTLVCHGGGEPALHPDLLGEALDAIEEIAREHGLPLFRYIATNGVMPAATAAWVALRFDLVGLSCDGPPDVQDKQRPAWGGGSSAPMVERTAAIVRQHGTPLHVRVTVTQQTVERQPEIAEYICRALRPSEIHVEAVYAAGRGQALAGTWAETEADRFVAGFLAARQVAARYGVRWANSGSRLGEIHGPYCHVAREVLNLVPGGAATGCFLVTEAAEAERRQVTVGRQVHDSLQLDQPGIDRMRRAVEAPPAACQACFNGYHCARACPDACEMDGPPAADGFLCRVRRRLAEAEIDALADRLWESLAGEDGCAVEALRQT